MKKTIQQRSHEAAARISFEPSSFERSRALVMQALKDQEEELCAREEGLKAEHKTYIENIRVILGLKEYERLPEACAAMRREIEKLSVEAQGFWDRALIAEREEGIWKSVATNSALHKNEAEASAQRAVLERDATRADCVNTVHSLNRELEAARAEISRLQGELERFAPAMFTALEITNSKQ